MQLELTLHQDKTDIQTRDLGFLLHKHPEHLHERELAWGNAYVFYPKIEEAFTKAVLYLDIDPVGLVRGRSAHGPSLLAQYVNDRPYTANSFLSVALSKVFGQSMSGKSKERQELAAIELPFEARVTPVSIAGGEELAKQLFEPLGYDVEAVSNDDDQKEIKYPLFDLRLKATIKLEHLLNHLYVLIPVLDNAKHYYVGHDEIENIIQKGEGWLISHPEKELITHRALKYRRGLANIALARLLEMEQRDQQVEEEKDASNEVSEEKLEKPIRLHDLRLDTVVEKLQSLNVNSVLDLGCGEGKLLKRLIKEKGIKKITGVDPSITSLERAEDKLYLKNANQALKERVSLIQGSLTYGDRRWKGYEAATLVEVIEHIDPFRMSALENSLFGFAGPEVIIITTPNREYNAVFENMPKDKLRHPDHRFEWSRAEFQNWANRVAEKFEYKVTFENLGPEQEEYGAPSQMGVFIK